MKKLQSRLAEKEEEISTVREKIEQKQEVADDLQMSEQRCQNQKMQIAKLEQRIDDLMAAQRASAEQIAFCKWKLRLHSSILLPAANAPLLANIDELENKLRENEAEKYVLQKKIRFAEENAEAAVKKSADEIANLKQQLATLRTSNTSAQEKTRRLKAYVQSFFSTVSLFRALGTTMNFKRSITNRKSCWRPSKARCFRKSPR